MKKVIKYLNKCNVKYIQNEAGDIIITGVLFHTQIKHLIKMSGIFVLVNDGKFIIHG